MTRKTTAVLLALGLLLTAIAASAGAAGKSSNRGRWDILGFSASGKTFTVVPGGTAQSKDAASGDTIDVTGSGNFNPAKKTASGGGTFVHKHADGSVFAHGIYVVTGLSRWQEGGGEPPKGVKDHAVDPGSARPASGILTLKVRIIPEDEGGMAGTPLKGVLKVFCHFEKNKLKIKEGDEGVQLKVGPFDFRQVEMKGATVFHFLK